MVSKLDNAASFTTQPITYWETPEQYKAADKEDRDAVRVDLKNFSNVRPAKLIGEVVAKDQDGGLPACLHKQEVSSRKTPEHQSRVFRNDRIKF